MSLPATLPEWLRLLETRHPVPIELGLDRIRAVWERLGAPCPAGKLITVAGTNGKGSTVAYATAMLRALGFRAGSYTSPHLLRYNERVRIEEVEVADVELLDAFAEIEAVRGETSLTYFEFGTLAAFVLLGRAGLDFAVLEVGLGGRLDAVNLLDTDCAVITPVGLDHQEYLGLDRESIGREKAGIIRAGKPLVCGEADPPRSVLDTAARLGAPVWRLDHEFSIADRGEGLHWSGPGGGLDLPRPPMRGVHQSANLATALAAVIALVPEALRAPAALARSVPSVRVPGRLQPVCDSPLVLLDVGHNPLAAQAVSGALRELGTRPAICVLGMLRDKDAGGVAAALDESVDLWYCAGLAGDRGRSAEALAGEVAAVGGAGRVRTFSSVDCAMRAALQAVAADQSILVFGSFRTAAEAATSLSAEAAGTA